MGLGELIVDTIDQLVDVSLKIGTDSTYRDTLSKVSLSRSLFYKKKSLHTYVHTYSLPLYMCTHIHKYTHMYNIDMDTTYRDNAQQGLSVSLVRFLRKSFSISIYTDIVSLYTSREREREREKERERGKERNGGGGVRERDSLPLYVCIHSCVYAHIYHQH